LKKPDLHQKKKCELPGGSFCFKNVRSQVGIIYPFDFLRKTAMHEFFKKCKVIGGYCPHTNVRNQMVV